MSVDISIAVRLCKQFEGFSSKPYLCPAGVATIGYGSTYYSNGSKVKLTDPWITEPAAAELLYTELQHKYLPSVIRLCPILVTEAASGNFKRINAILDFVYNLGAGNLQISTLRKKINASDWEAAAVEIMKWNKGGGKILPGLVRRRTAERQLLL